MPRATRALAITLLLACGCARSIADSAPDWVRAAAKQDLPTYPSDTNAAVVMEEQNMTVTAAGEYVEHYRRAVKILRPDGRDQGNLWVYLGHGEKLLSLRAWTIDKNGREYELKEKDFQERSPYTDVFYEDIRYRAVKAPAPEPGAVVALEYECRRHAWDNQLHWIVQGEIPTWETTFTLQLPPGWEYKSAWSGGALAEGVGGKNAAGKDMGGNRWQWKKHDLPALEEEPRMPAFGALAMRMAIAFFGQGEDTANSATWSGLGRWYSGLTAGRRTASPEISERVRQLTAGQSTFDGKLRALTGFLQNEIRYVGIEIGIGGYQPHPASDVFHFRDGDCKDKATLLSSMLHEAGINSEYVLIDTERGVVQPSMPSSWFNHAILAVELPDSEAARYQSVVRTKSGKRYLIFDPTDPYTPTGQLRADLQDTYALLVTDGGGELIHTPLMAPETNLLSRTGHFTLGSDGTLTGEIAETLTGEHAFRSRAHLRNASDKERTEEFERLLGRSMKGFLLQSSSIQQLDDIQKELLLSLKFDAPGYAQIRGPLMLVRPRIVGEKSFDLDHRKPRRHPVQFDGTSKETDVFEIELPAGYAVDDVPEPTKVDVGFASYESKIEVTGSKLRYWREYTRRNVDIGAERVADLRKFEGSIGADEAASVVLKRVE